MRVKEVKCHVFCLFFKDGFGVDEIKAIKPCLIKTDFNQLLQPATILVYIRQSFGSVKKIRRTKEALEKYSKQYDAQLGESSGKLALELALTGRILSPPIGIIINHAMDNAWSKNDT